MLIPAFKGIVHPKMKALVQVLPATQNFHFWVNYPFNGPELA